MTKEYLYVNPYSPYADCNMTKIEVRDAILDEIYEIAVEKNITTLKELKKFLPKHIARSALE